MSNVCTHRGNILALGADKVKRIKCSYHGRTFDLKGNFKSMPEFSLTEDFPRDCDNLYQFPLYEWGPFLFAGLNPSFDFEEVINSCSNIKRLSQKGTWITPGLKESFIKLHEMGLAISVEVWKNSQIVGGLYGLDLGDVFCGESMFSKFTNSSKVALVALASELKNNNY